MKFIDDWKASHKFASMQLLFFASLCDIIVTGLVIIDDKFPFNPMWYVLLRLSLTVGSMLARLVAQTNLNPNKEDQ